MAIVRASQSEYAVDRRKRVPLTERKRDNFDLGWKSGNTEYRVYVLDAHEWVDPHTSSKYDNHTGSRISHHAMRGPSLVVEVMSPSHCVTTEHELNDPHTWAWIRRSIAEGHLIAATMLPGCADELAVKQAESCERVGG